MRERESNRCVLFVLVYVFVTHAHTQTHIYVHSCIHALTHTHIFTRVLSDFNAYDKAFIAKHRCVFLTSQCVYVCVCV